MTWTVHETEAISTLREVSGEDRMVEGLAVPYGTISPDTELGREAFAPGAFAGSVAQWMSATDGRRPAFRPAHKEPPIGSVVELRDTPEGVVFRAKIRPGPRGDEYLENVRDGLNGVSIEAVLSRDSRRGRDGTVIHRSARLLAIAGSVSPAYDGARVSARDMEDPVTEESTPTTEAAADDRSVPEPSTSELQAASRDAVVQLSSLPAERSTLRITRPEAVYAPGGGHAFFSDLAAAKSGDSAAGDRQARHNAHLTDVAGQIERAGDMLSSEIPGAYPNDYLPGLLTPRILKGRPMGGFYTRVPISDAKPKIFAKVTTSTSVAVQSAEGAALSATDIATTAVTATPLIYGAYIDVSRQVLDGADPSAQSILLTDLLEAYGQASETVIKTAVEAGSTASGTAITAATPYAGVAANVVTYYGTRFKPAEGAFIPSALYSVLLAQGDTTGRPFLPMIGSMNSDGTVSNGGIQANVLGAATKLSYASTVNVCVFGVPNDFVIFESSVASFSYDQIVGPQAVRLGIWAYLVVGTRLGSLKVTAV